MQQIGLLVQWVWVSSVLRPHQHSIGYTGDGFYRSKDPTNSIKVQRASVSKYVSKQEQLVSKATEVTAYCVVCRHCTITGVRNVKHASFKPWPEDCYRRCRSDKIWQTVSDTCSGDRESSVTDRWIRKLAKCSWQSMIRIYWNGFAEEPRHLPPDKARQ